MRGEKEKGKKREGGGGGGEGRGGAGLVDDAEEDKKNTDNKADVVIREN